MNNKIKTMKRKAYGYRDERFFDLKVLSIHAGTYAFL
ncbi:MAG: transposase [Mediterranea sp.]|nr:transposase [Mediterranea sp.]